MADISRPVLFSVLLRGTIMICKGCKQRKHYLAPIGTAKGGINGHSAFYCQVNDIEIYSNNDILGDKWYMTKGEQADTIWYPSPTAAAIAYFEQGAKAVTKTARRYD